MSMKDGLATFQARIDDSNYMSLSCSKKAVSVDKIVNGEVERLFTCASKDNLPGLLRIITIEGSYMSLTPNEEKVDTLSTAAVPADYEAVAVVDAYSGSPGISVGNRYFESSNKTVVMNIRNVAGVTISAYTYARVLCVKR